MSPAIRQTVYLLGTIVPAVLGILLVWGGIEQGTADNLNIVIAGLLSFLGAGAPALAAKKVGEQKRDGTLLTTPAERVTQGVQDVLAAHAATTAQVEQVKQAVTSAVGIVQGMGPLAAQVINSTPNPYSR